MSFRPDPRTVWGYFRVGKGRWTVPLRSPLFRVRFLREFTGNFPEYDVSRGFNVPKKNENTTANSAALSG